jgi:hypothetical protein
LNLEAAAIGGKVGLFGEFEVFCFGGDTFTTRFFCSGEQLRILKSKSREIKLQKTFN